MSQRQPIPEGVELEGIALFKKPYLTKMFIGKGDSEEMSNPIEEWLEAQSYEGYVLHSITDSLVSAGPAGVRIVCRATVELYSVRTEGPIPQ